MSTIDAEHKAIPDALRWFMHHFRDDADRQTSAFFIHSEQQYRDKRTGELKYKTQGEDAFLATRPEGRLATWQRHNEALWNVYAELGVRKLERENVKRAKIPDMMHMRHLPFDVDPREGEAVADVLARVQAVLKSLDLVPGMLWVTGSGVQFSFRLDQPCADFKRLEKVGKALRSEFGSDAVFSPEHLFRVPGFTNHPNAQKRDKGRVPAPSYIVSESDSIYSLDQLAAKVTPPPYEKRTPGRPGKSPRSDGHNPNPLWQDYIESGKASDELVDYRQDKKPEADVTDSGHIMALVMHLAGIGWDREKVVAVLTDSANGIAGIINTKGISWLDLTLKKVTWKTAPRIRLGNQLDVARKFRAAEHPSLIYYRSEFWTYSWGIYHALDKVAVESELALWLETCEAFDSEAECYAPFAPSIKFVREILAMLKNATHLDPPTLDDGREGDMPFWRLGHDDPDFPPGHCLVCAEQIVNLVTGAVRPITPEFVTRNGISVTYDPTADCPSWKRCMGESWFKGRPKDAMTLQEFLGLSLIDCMDFHKGLILWGARRSGKGTIVHQHTRLLGAGNVTSPSMKELDESFGLQPLLKALLAVFSDARTEDRAPLNVTERLLRLIGGDRMNANRKGIPALIGVPMKARVLITANAQPSFRDDTGTIASRFLILEMPESFYNKEDLHLKVKLAAELPGYLNWCIEGLRRLLTKGQFTMSDAAVAAQRDMEREASAIKAFVEDTLIIDGDAWMPTYELYANYRAWCLENGTHPLPSNKFAPKLRALEPKLIRASKRADPKDGERVPGYTGVRLLKPVPSYAEHMFAPFGAAG